MGIWPPQGSHPHDHQLVRAAPPGRSRCCGRAGWRLAPERRKRREEGGVLPTVTEVLALEAVRRGQPRVVAGAHRLDTPVRWGHAIEFADAAPLLRRGGLVLAPRVA